MKEEEEKKFQDDMFRGNHQRPTFKNSKKESQDERQDISGGNAIVAEHRTVNDISKP